MVASELNWEYKGFAVSGYYSNAFNIAGFYKTIDYLKACGANSIELIVTWYQDDYYSTEIYKHKSKSLDDSLLIKAIEYIHKQGLKVNLNPHVDPFPGKGGWRAKIVPTDVAKWFKSYQLFIEHFLKISIKHHVEVFTIGTEFISVTQPEYFNYWADIVMFIREYQGGAFRGKLTYIADKTEVFGMDEFFLGNNKPVKVLPLDSKFWELFDFISISAFFEVGDSKMAAPDLESVTYDWNNKWIPRLENWKRNLNTDKKVVIGEIGYRSNDFAHCAPMLHPGETYRNSKDKFNSLVQVNCYKAMFQELMKINWLSGIYLWEEEIKNPPAYENPENIGFSIINKESSQVVLNYYGSTFQDMKIAKIENNRKDRLFNSYLFISYWIEINLQKISKLVKLFV